ncbi:probable WRKY transcription factor 65 [Carya illinoinensis]|uniref:probable WRKY transcription factor 65 n=1 Tax=Carya illinoinensis TaxID=32201 RepID=UPI001C71F522|nr:probable WRKY transcription factor 65 [Carya illinoinensis]
MLVVTYSCEHNHMWPASRNHHSTNKPVKLETIASAKPKPEDKFADLEDESSLMASNEFSWFSDMETTSSTVLESPIFAERSSGDVDVAMFFPMREEDESL